MDPLKLACVLMLAISFCQAFTFKDDTTLTKHQSSALRKFKKRMEPSLTKDWMRDDIFLLRFLRYKNFDVSRAQEFLNTHLAWRKADKMDTIHEEDWSDMERDYTYDISKTDRDGRVLIRWDMGEWDIRKAAVAGKLHRLVRYTNKMWEEARIKIFKSYSEGKNVTRWTMIMDMEKINAIQHVNPTCIPFFLSLAATYEGNFPNLGDNIYFLNTPGLFETVLVLVRPILTDGTKNALQVYGKERNVWEPVVRARIDPSFLPENYGGTAF